MSENSTENKKPKVEIMRIFPTNGTIKGGTEIIISFQLEQNNNPKHYCYCKFGSHIITGELIEKGIINKAKCISPPSNQSMVVDFSFSYDRIHWSNAVKYEYIYTFSFSLMYVFTPIIVLVLSFFSAVFYAAIQKNKKRNRRKAARRQLLNQEFVQRKPKKGSNTKRRINLL